MRLRVLLLALCVLAAQRDASRADGLVRDGVGPVAMGRAGANIGHADNGAILLDNPAGLVNVAGDGLFEAGLDLMVHDIEFANPITRDTAETELNTLPQAAVIRKFGDGRWAAGLGVFLPAGFGAEYHLTNPVFGPQQYRSLGVLGKILPAVAYRVNDDLSIGGTLGVGISHVELEGPLALQTGPLAGTPGLIDLKANDAALTWSVGLQYALSDTTTIGLAYVSSSQFDLEGEVEARLFAPPLGLLASRFDADMSIEWPRSAGVGIKHLLADRHRVSLDVVYFNWADAFGGFDLTLRNPSNPVVAAVAGNVIRDRIPADWHDTVSLRFGYEWLVDDRDVWRAGYAYHPRPAPTATLNPYTDGLLEHVFSVGYERRWHGWRWNAAYQFNFGPERSVGTSRFLGGDFDNSRLSADCHWLALSAIHAF